MLFSRLISIFVFVNGVKSFQQKNTLRTNKESLIKLVEGTKYGLKSDKVNDMNIQRLIESLKTSPDKFKSPASSFSDSKRKSSLLGGKWNLLYTNGPDVLSIGKIPGVTLEYVGQTVDTAENIITNIVYTKGLIADTFQEVYVGCKQVSPTRVELDFKGTKIKFLKLFGQEKLLGFDVAKLNPIEVQFNKEDLEKNLKKSNRPTPSFDIEYLDEDLRIQRTAEGYTFIIRKEELVKSTSVGIADGLGPWLKSKIGDNGMKALGVVSITPYLFFIIKFIQQNVIN